MAAAPGTVTYRYPPAVAGGAVAPTQAQVALLSEVSFDLAMPDNASATAVVHNFNLAPADGSSGTPQVHAIATVLGAAPATLGIAFTDANTLTFTQSPNAGAGNGCTWRVTVKRPNTITR